MRDRETEIWILQQEKKTLFDDYNNRISLDDAAKVFNNCCHISEITKINGGGGRGLADAISGGKNHVSVLEIKRALIIDLPIASVETLFADPYADKVREISAGLYPLHYSRIVNACATKSRNGRNVIFFSDGLFSLLWDYYDRLVTTVNSDRPDSMSNIADSIEADIVRKMRSGTFRNFRTRKILSAKSYSPRIKQLTFLATLFVWFHELGHIFLGHLDDNNCFLKEASAMPEYSKSVNQELEADRFAFDCYIAFLDRFVKTGDDQAGEAILAGLKVLELLAKAEGPDINFDLTTDSHPPSALRAAYIILRYEERFRRLTKFGSMIDEFHEIDRNYKNLNFNYKKENEFHFMYR